MMNHKSLSMDAIAKWQHGSNARAILTRDHSYGWGAILPDGSIQGLDLQGYFSQYNKNIRVVHTGLDCGGWATFNPFAQENQFIVQMTLIISRQMVNDIDGVNQAIERYRNNWEYARDWIRRKLGRTFKLSDKTHLVIVKETPQQMLDIARSTTEKGKRGELLWFCRDKYIARYRRVNPNIIYAHAFYTGHHPDEDFGSAQSGHHLALSSDNTSVAVDWAMNDAKSRRIGYDTVHELNHAFGCPHTTPEDGENWTQDIMYHGEPENALILPSTRAILMRSPYLT